MRQWISKYWFITALVLVSAATLADRHEWTVSAGRWLKHHNGPNMVIGFIFFFSGVTLDARLLGKGLKDVNATASALMVIFVLAPLLALACQWLPLDVQILTGLYLVAVMPPTMSSGVVMTDRAGGNMAHALFVTILANAVAVLTIPLVLSFMLTTLGDHRSIEIDKTAIMIKIALLVLLPLAMGMCIQSTCRNTIAALQPKVQIINQLFILTIVWMAMCQSRAAIVTGGHALLPVAALVFSFHLILVMLALATAEIFQIGPGRRESVIFMGGQKTLPLSVILQVSLFPDYGLALVVCVAHHIIHLIMDAYLVEKIKIKSKDS
jgi:sodium/bile acid cotransporter 7